MRNKIRFLYHDPLYRNSIAMMLNSAFSAFFGLLFWIVAARGHVGEGAWDCMMWGGGDQYKEGRLDLTYFIYLHSPGARYEPHTVTQLKKPQMHADKRRFNATLFENLFEKILRPLCSRGSHARENPETGGRTIPLEPIGCAGFDALI